MPIENIQGGQPYSNHGPLDGHSASTNQRLAVYQQNWRGTVAWDSWNYGDTGSNYTPLFRSLLYDWTSQAIGNIRSQRIPQSPPPIAAENYALSNRTAQWGNYFATLPRSMGG
jgi:hypothetical protein